MTNEEFQEKRNKLRHWMRKELSDGTHTMNSCSCGLTKRGGNPRCLSCLAHEYRILLTQYGKKGKK